MLVLGISAYIFFFSASVLFLLTAGNTFVAWQSHIEQCFSKYEAKYNKLNMSK